MERLYILLRENGDDTDRRSRPSGDFHRQGYQAAASRRNLFKPRDVFQAVEAGAVHYSMDRKLLRRTMVDARGIDSHSMNVSLCDQKLGSL